MTSKKQVDMKTPPAKQDKYESQQLFEWSFPRLASVRNSLEYLI